MQVDVRSHGDVIVVDLDGRLVAGVGDEVLRDVVNELLAEGWKHILLNMAKVSRIDSSGIGELVASTKLAESFGSAVKLVQPSDPIRRILDLSQILPLLECHEDEGEALRSFVADPETTSHG